MFSQREIEIVVEGVEEEVVEEVFVEDEVVGMVAGI